MSDTKKIRVLLYKAKWGDKSIVDNLISIWTRSKYSHIEIWTPDEDGKFSEISCQDGKLESYVGQDETVTATYTMPCYRFKAFGTCWTSTMRGEDNGTVKRDASGVIKNADRWDYVEIEMHEIDYKYMVDRMIIEVNANKGYSKRDILKFIFPIHFPDNKRNICSEFVNNALWFADIVEGWGIVSPKKVHQKLTALGYETKSL